MKAILVIDMPESCDECPCYYKDFFVCRVAKKENENWYGIKPNWCPLRPLPEKLEPKLSVVVTIGERENDIYLTAYDVGWNNCLDEIGGEDEIDTHN